MEKGFRFLKPFLGLADILLRHKKLPNQKQNRRYWRFIISWCRMADFIYPHTGA